MIFASSLSGVSVCCRHGRYRRAFRPASADKNVRRRFLVAVGFPQRPRLACIASLASGTNTSSRHSAPHPSRRPFNPTAGFAFSCAERMCQCLCGGNCIARIAQCCQLPRRRDGIGDFQPNPRPARRRRACSRGAVRAARSGCTFSKPQSAGMRPSLMPPTQSSKAVCGE